MPKALLDGEAVENFPRLAGRPRLLRPRSGGAGSAGASHDDLDTLVAALRQLEAQGCVIAVDDFGASHANIDRLWRLEPDIVKLDRSLR